MRLRTVGAGLALALAGIAGGFVVGNVLEDQPAPIAVIEPVPAQSPSYPFTEYDVLPDPSIAPLGVDLPSHAATFVVGNRGLRASVPDGWRRAPLDGGDAWNFSPPDNPANTYILRVGLVARVSVQAGIGGRILALQDAQANGNLQHLVIERSDDGFVATYIDDGYLRVTMERWLTLGGTTAYTAIAVTGREQDREGMADLLERVSSSAVPVTGSVTSRGP